jgi:hypothetical protein
MAMVIYNLLVFHIVPVVMLRLENLIIALLQFLIVVFDELSCVCDTVLLLREHLRFFTAIKIVVCLDRVSRIFKNLLPVVLPSRFSNEFGHVTRRMLVDVVFICILFFDLFALLRVQFSGRKVRTAIFKPSAEKLKLVP